MKFELSPLNTFWLLIPILAWNIILGPKITDPRVLSDASSPSWLLTVENLTRLGIFALPLFIPLRLDTPMKKAGLAIFIIGALIYLATWLPLILAPGSAWSSSPAGILAPRLTPLLPFLGIAMIGGNWLYAALSLIFIFFHTWHGIQNL